MHIRFQAGRVFCNAQNIGSHLWRSHAALVPDIPEPMTAMRFEAGDSMTCKSAKEDKHWFLVDTMPKRDVRESSRTRRLAK